MAGELGPDGAKLYWLLLLMLLCLPLIIWLSVVLSDLGVSNWNLPSWRQEELCVMGYSRPPGRYAVLSLVGGGALCPWLEQACWL